MSKYFIFRIEQNQREFGIVDWTELIKNKHCEKIIVFDVFEVDRFFPLHEDHYEVFHNLSLICQGIDSEVYYICSDCNIQNMYQSYCEKYNPFKKINVLTYPYFICNPKPIFTVGDAKLLYEDNKLYYYIFKKDSPFNDDFFLYDKNFLENKNSYYPEINVSKIDVGIKYNFISLVSSPKIFRMMLLDKFYNHKNFKYSFYPYPHLTPKEHENIKKDNNITDFKVIKKPSIYEDRKIKDYWWANSDDHIKYQNIVDNDVYNIFIGISGIYNMDFLNGFKYNKKYFTELTEIVDMLNLKEYHEFNLTEYSAKEIVNLPEKKYEAMEDKHTMNNFIPLEYMKSCVDLVCESYATNSIFFTEKTWKAICFKKPFLILGAKNQNLMLKKLGFEIFEEIFDYTFDEQENFKNRFNGYCNQVNRYMNLKPHKFEEILSRVKNKIEHNYNLYLDIIKSQDKTNFFDYLNHELVDDKYDEFILYLRNNQENWNFKDERY